MPSVKERLLDYFARFSTKHAPYFVPGAQDRIWVHDTLHAVLGLGPNYRDEQIIAIYQSVLLNSLHVSRRKGIFTPKETPVTLEDMHEHIMPKVSKFIFSLSKEFGFKVNPKNKLQDDEISFFYQKARVLSKLINRHMGTALRKDTIPQFLALPFDDLCKLKAVSDRMFLADAAPFAFAKTPKKQSNRLG